MNTRRLRFTHWLFLACGVWMVSACGGGGQSASGGTGGTGMVAVRGPIQSTTTAGSAKATGVAVGVVATATITVNNVTYDTIGATINAGGSSLAPGMVVTVHGVINLDAAGQSLGTGTADTVDYARNLMGPAVNLAAAGFSVYGQAVEFSTETQFEDLGGNRLTNLTALPEWLIAGVTVEVSGYVSVDATGSGHVHATYIKELAASPELEMDGVIEIINQNGNTLWVSGTEVNTAFANPAPAWDTLYRGAIVKVVGTPTDPNDPAKPLIASSVVLVNRDLGDDGDRVEIRGLITDVTRIDASSGTLVVDGVKASYSATTAFKYNGLTRDTLAPGMTVEVEGRIYSGVIRASEIESLPH